MGAYPAQSMFFHGIPSKYGKNRRTKEAGHFWKSKCSLEQAKQWALFSFSVALPFAEDRFHLIACHPETPKEFRQCFTSIWTPTQGGRDCQCSFEVHAFCTMEVVFTVPPVPQICRLSRTSLASPTSKIWWLLFACELRFHEVIFCTLTIDE